jgi:hypothetical protein
VQRLSPAFQLPVRERSLPCGVRGPVDAPPSGAGQLYTLAAILTG